MKLLIFLFVTLLMIQMFNCASLNIPLKWEFEIPIFPSPRNEKTLGIFDKREASKQEEQKQSITDGVIVDPDKAIIDGSAGLLKIVKK